MKKKISLILALVLVFSLMLTACTEPTPPQTQEYVLASEIDAETKADAEEVLSAFMQAFEEDNASIATSLFSSDFEATEENIGAFFDELHKLVTVPFVPYDAYYVKGLEVSDLPIKVRKGADAEECIEITPGKEEMYCAMYVSEGEKVSYMMTVLLVKEGADFRIVWVNPTDFEYNGLGANELYAKTKELEDGKKLIPAYVSSCMLSNIFRPGGYLRYANDAEMEDICYRLFKEIAATYPLPLELEGTTESSVYEIGIANDNELGILPLIVLKTSADVNDETALRSEGEKALAALEKLSPGMSDSFEYIRFEATNDEITEETTAINKKVLNLKLK